MHDRHFGKIYIYIRGVNKKFVHFVYKTVTISPIAVKLSHIANANKVDMYAKFY